MGRSQSRSHDHSGRHRWVLVVASLVAALLPVTTAVASAGATPVVTAPAATAAAPGAGAAGGFHVHLAPGGHTDVNACSDIVAPGYARCFARVRTDTRGHPVPATDGAGVVAPAVGLGGAYSPAYLQSAYNAPSATAGAGQTVAVVDAYDDPSAAADLAIYRSEYGLPACTTASGCFTKVNQTGGSSLPTADANWAEEISLDLDMVSAICPKCRILLVEATTSWLPDLGTAVNTAVSLGAAVVSNSYGGNEYSSEASDGAQYFTHPGVALVVSSGDSGYGVQFPAASPTVIAVGGTSLFQSTATGTRNGSETAWAGAGSGCSQYEPKPAWQQDVGCAQRSVADVSAVADPNTGVWIYDTYRSDGGGDLIVGGTSAAAPIIGAMYALTANPRPSANTVSAYPYSRTAMLNDVTSGSNGSCSPTYLCTAGVGYDGPTGLGTPKGTAPFDARTTTALSSSANPSAGQQAVTFTATVTAVTGSVHPTGQVTFRDANTTLGTAALNGTGVATLTTSALAGGSHSITAGYTGVQAFAASLSAAVTQSVWVPPVWSADSPPTSASVSVPYSYTFAASGPPAPAFTVRSGALPAGLTLAPATGTLSGTPTVVGSATFTVGAANGAAPDAVSPDITITVAPAPPATSTALSSSVNPSAMAQSVTFTATVTAPSASGVPTGTVTFRDGSQSLGAVPLDGTGTAALTTSALTAGSHPVSAGYGGPGFGSSTSPTVSQTVALTFEDLGCCLAAGSGPATSTWGLGRLDVVIRGTNNVLYHKSFAGSWSGYESLGGATIDNPAVVSWSPGRLDVFVRGSDNQLWHKWFAGGVWSAWEGLGGTLVSAPTVTSWGPGRLDVFVQGTDNRLYHKWFSGGAWSGWEGLGGALTSAPSAASSSYGRIDVVARGSGSVTHLSFAGAWSGWAGIGGPTIGSPQLSSPGSGRLELFGRDLGDNGLDHMSFNGVWSAATDQGGGLSGPPAAVEWNAGRIDVFTNGLIGRTGRSGDLMHTSSG